MKYYDLDRSVGEESRRTYKFKVLNGFFDRYMSGFGLEIGGTGYIEGVVSILPTATNIEVDYPGYDGLHLPFEDESQDYVYSSHCLEHISDFETALKEWHRVLKVGGHMIIVVPHQYLYEKKRNLPSKWNEDHKRFYTPKSLLMEIEYSLKPNSYRVRHLQDNDTGYSYHLGPEKHGNGPYEIEVVLQKIKTPNWELE
jgi:SAM-dependent methyltransferase